MEKPSKQSQAHLFTVQLWLEELGNGQAEWRGQVKNVANGDECYFREWSAVGGLIRAMLPTADVKRAGLVQNEPLSSVASLR